MKLGVKINNIEGELRKLAKSIREATLSNTQLTATKLVEALAAATPVDTGKARDSWTLEKGSKNDVIVSNELDYINYLNEGSSEQAPSHFVEKTAIKFGVPRGAIAIKR